MKNLLASGRTSEHLKGQKDKSAKNKILAKQSKKIKQRGLTLCASEKPLQKNSTSLLDTMPFHIFIEDCASPWEYSPLTSTASTSTIEFARFESEDVSGRAEEEGRFKEAWGPFSVE